MSATLLFVQTVLRLNELVMWRCWFLFSVDVKLLKTGPLCLCRPRSQRYATHLARSVFILVLTAFSILTSLVTAVLDSLYTHRISKRTVQNCFCQNFVKFSPISITFGRRMTKKPKLCKVHSFSTSPNSRRHTTLLNADVQIVTQHRK